MEYNEARRQIDVILDGEDEERAWFARARALRRDPDLEAKEQVGELYQRHVSGIPLSPADRRRLLRDGPKLLGINKPPAWMLKPNRRGR